MIHHIKSGKTLFTEICFSSKTLEPANVCLLFETFTGNMRCCEVPGQINILVRVLFWNAYLVRVQPDRWGLPPGPEEAAQLH